MRRTHQALITLALGLALITTSAAAAVATPPTGTPDQAELERTLARHRALGALDAIAAQPAARTDPAAPSPGVDVLTRLGMATVVFLLAGGLGLMAARRAGRKAPSRPGSLTGVMPSDGATAPTGSPTERAPRSAG